MNTTTRLLTPGTLSHDVAASIASAIARVQFGMVTLVTAVLISGLSVVYATNASRGLNAGLQQAMTERNQLHIQWSQLLLEKGTWVMQARVEQVAADKLGMYIPDSKSITVVSSNG